MEVACFAMICAFYGANSIVLNITRGRAVANRKKDGHATLLSANLCERLYVILDHISGAYRTVFD
jgi:hypothetical protein